jgi:glutaredoxin
VASGPRVELLWWRECPSWERAHAILHEAMEEAGLDPASVEITEVSSEEAAADEGFIGSPTIRIDGADVQPPPEPQPAGLTCRVYHRRDGSTSPLPDPEDLRDALRAAAIG